MSIAAQVAGADADVTSIITQPGRRPARLRADRRRTPATIASARLVIVNGIGYDPWAEQLLDGDPGHDRTVLDVGDVLGVPDGGEPASVVLARRGRRRSSRR